jgi:ATP-binding cassette subfamily F protein 3
MLRIDSLTYRIGGRVLFDQATATIGAGHKVGLVGRNGTGKTTLLRLVAGELEADGGRIEVPPRWRIGWTRQEAPGGDDTPLAIVIGSDAELARLRHEADAVRDPARLAAVHERLHAKQGYAAEARAARILAGLGFDAAAQEQPCRVFSGGMRMRIALATLLFTTPELLLLDEPTNHLDLEAAMWLENELRAYPGTLVVVSHDRTLLNQLTTEILHLENARLTLYSGGYDRFEAVREQRRVLDDKQRRKQDAQRERTQAFIDRFRYKASKARQAQSRLKLLERMPATVALREEAAVTFQFPDPGPLPPPLLGMRDVWVGYDGQAVLRGLDLRIDAEDRIALLGANGNGKSTLLKLLAGRLQPLSGEITRSSKMRIGYFAQHQADVLDLDVTPVRELARRRRQDTDERLRAHLGRFAFSQARADTPIGALSGGEKARLLFALITSEAPHMLLLDEPTNHLDLSARHALIEALNEFPGAVILVSHDPHVIELTADRLWLVEAGTLNSFDGDLQDYRARLLAADASGARQAAGGRGKGSQRKAERRQAAERQAALAPLKRKVALAEGTVDRLATQKAEIETALAQPDLYGGGNGDLVGLQVRLKQVADALAAAEEEWLQVHEDLEQADRSLS